ncbi:Transmembrane protein 18 [Mactra antiquata]
MDGNSEYGGPVKPIRINEIDGLITFLQSIDWKEPWFSGLAIFHITCAILTVLTRNLGVVQSAYFGLLMILVFCAEYINEWAASNWNLFAHQQYFDSNGLFISIVFSVPLLINCLIIVVSWLWDVGVLISNVKQMKIHQRSLRKEKKDNVSKSDDKEIEEDTKKER